MFKHLLFHIYIYTSTHTLDNSSLKLTLMLLVLNERFINLILVNMILKTEQKKPTISLHVFLSVGRYINENYLLVFIFAFEHFQCYSIGFTFCINK